MYDYPTIYSRCYKATAVLSISVTLYHIEAETDGRQFADDIFELTFLYERCISIQITLKFVIKEPINNNPAQVQIMA